jgi:diaminopimelate epimerase
MLLNFEKYHGTGNDFILFDDRELKFNPTPERIIRLCDRRFGIGSDGLLLLHDRKGFDFEMVYYNPDGSPATFCGNGSRCIIAFARSLGIGGKDFHFLAADAPHRASIISDNGAETQVSVSMIDPVIYNHSDDSAYLNSGTYHVVRFVDDPDAIDIMQAGPKVRYDEIYAPHGTNVNFAVVRNGSIYMRTYEKGVEAETLSCGTGVTATAIAASFRTGKTDYKIVTRGGSLRVHFSKNGDSISNVFLEGPAMKVFSGLIKL